MCVVLYGIQLAEINGLVSAAGIAKFLLYLRSLQGDIETGLI